MAAIRISGEGAIGRALLWLVVPALAFVQLWYSSAGTFRWVFPDGPYYTLDYYQQLTDAYRSRQLHLLVTPSPELLALPDPFEPSARQGVPFQFDTLLYNGRYYFFYGPTPAILLWVFGKLIPARVVPDSWIAVTASIGLTAGLALLLTRLRANYFPRSPAWLAAVALAVVALGNPVLFMLARPSLYEASQLTSQCFLILAIALGLPAPDRPRASYWFLCAGTTGGLAFASRFTLLPAVLLLAGALSIAHLRQHVPSVRFGRRLLPLLCL